MNLKKICKLIISVIIGLIMYLAIFSLCIPWVMSVCQHPTSTICGIECPAIVWGVIGWLLVIIGSCVYAAIAFFVGWLCYDWHSAIMPFKNGDIHKTISQNKWWIILVIVGAIFVIALIWWLCVSITPWFILFAPGLIIGILTGRKRH